MIFLGWRIVIPKILRIQKILVDKVDKKEMYKTICLNIKKYRLQKYEEFKRNNTKNIINPFTTENISALLDYNHTHYKRFESENDTTKMIPLEKLVKLSLILGVKIDDFFK